MPMIRYLEEALQAAEAPGGTRAGAGASMGIAPAPPARLEAGANPPSRIRVGGNVQKANLIHRIPPNYPELARQAGITGEVQLSAIIGREGTILSLTVLSGHPLLIPAALEAVKQWVYRPTLLNGVPVEVITPSAVSFPPQ